GSSTRTQCGSFRCCPGWNQRHEMHISPFAPGCSEYSASSWVAFLKVCSPGFDIGEPHDFDFQRPAALAGMAQIDFVAILLRRQLGHQPLSGVHPKPRAVDVLVVDALV